MSEFIKYLKGNENLLNNIEDLWDASRIEHSKKSLYFKEQFEKFTFIERKQSFIEKCKNGELLVVIAQNEEDENIGYCISSVVNNVGEIDSLFLTPKYRKNGIGYNLVETSMKWINDHNPERIVVSVGVGNEEVIPFYNKFGFYSNLISLEVKK